MMPRILITPEARKHGITDRHPIVQSMARPGLCVIVTILTKPKAR